MELFFIAQRLARSIPCWGITRRHFAYDENILNAIMDFSYSLGTTVQVVDQIGQWEPATIATFTDAGYMVQFDGWGPEWDLEVSPAEMRLPLKKQSKSLLFHFFGLILLSFQLSASNTKLTAIPFSHISRKSSDRRMACDPTCSLTYNPVLNRFKEWAHIFQSTPWDLN